MELTIANLKPFLPALEAVLDDEAVSEVMINGPAAVIVEWSGRITALEASALTRAAIPIARPPGENPATDLIIDTPLTDPSRVAVLCPSVAPATATTFLTSPAGHSLSTS